MNHLLEEDESSGWRRSRGYEDASSGWQYGGGSLMVLKFPSRNTEKYGERQVQLACAGLIVACQGSSFFDIRQWLNPRLSPHFGLSEKSRNPVDCLNQLYALFLEKYGGTASPGYHIWKIQTKQTSTTWLKTRWRKPTMICLKIQRVPTRVLFKKYGIPQWMTHRHI